MDTQLIHHALVWLAKEIEEGLHDPPVDAKVETLLAKGWEITKERLLEFIDKWDGTEDSLH